jgi:hypothetical protein
MQISRISVDTVREWRATMHEAVEAGEWAPKTINNARVAPLGCFRMAVADRLMAHNPVLDVKPLPIDFTERPYLQIAQINRYVDACSAHYRPLAAFLVSPAGYTSLVLPSADVERGGCGKHVMLARAGGLDGAARLAGGTEPGEVAERDAEGGVPPAHRVGEAHARLLREVVEFAAPAGTGGGR